MNKNTYILGAIIGSLMCSMAWAGIPGTYHCQPPATDKHGKDNIVVHKNGDKYSFAMSFVGDDKKAYGTLINTQASNRFIHSWKYKTGVGASEWTFNNKSLTIDSLHLHVDSKEKMHKITHCTKK